MTDEQFLRGMNIVPDIAPQGLRIGPLPMHTLPMQPAVSQGQIAARIEDGEAIMSAQDFGQLLSANCDLESRLQLVRAAYEDVNSQLCRAEVKVREWRSCCILACAFAALAVGSVIWLARA